MDRRASLTRRRNETAATPTAEDVAAITGVHASPDGHASPGDRESSSGTERPTDDELAELVFVGRRIGERRRAASELVAVPDNQSSLLLFSPVLVLAVLAPLGMALGQPKLVSVVLFASALFMVKDFVFQLRRAWVSRVTESGFVLAAACLLALAFHPSFVGLLTIAQLVSAVIVCDRVQRGTRLQILYLLNTLCGAAVVELAFGLAAGGTNRMASSLGATLVLLTVSGSVITGRLRSWILVPAIGASGFAATYSGTGFGPLIVGVAVCALTAMFKYPSLRKTAFAAIVTGVVGGLAGMMLLNTTQASTSWTSGVEQFVDHWLIGVGPGVGIGQTAASVASSVREDALAQVPSPAALVIESGLPAVLGLCVLAFALVPVFKRRRLAPVLPLIGCAAAAVPGHWLWTSASGMSLAAIALGFVVVLSRDADISERLPPRRRRRD